MTTAASHILDGFIPPYDSTVTARLDAAGGVMMGKLNLDEFAMGSSNETSFYRPGRQSLAQQQGPRAALGARRIFRRFGGGGSGAAGDGGDRYRYRRFNSDNQLPFVDWLGFKTELWSLFAVGCGGLCLLPRSGRAHDP